MSATYRPVSWNRNKIIYDAILLIAVTVYLWIFIQVTPALRPAAAQIDGDILRMRAYGSCAFLMLSFILCIGPLARLDPRWLPVLYNRRHFGVLTCAVALVHAYYVLGWYFAFSQVDPFVALLSSNTSFARIAGFPFELFGIAALAILLILAGTSHDFWLSFLTPPVWKAMHMSLYAGYAAIVLHLALGPLMVQANAAFAIVVAFSVVSVGGLHLAAAWQGAAQDRAAAQGASPSPWISAGLISDLPEGRGRVVRVEGGESIAVFRHGGKISALANACAHQNGPLGEGRIIDGCVTCPWHGFQYRPEDGRAPPPFTEKLATYRVRLEDGFVLVDPRANPPGTYVEPVVIAGDNR